jgi:Heparinase II/III-like protein/Heparinase II/III N-terminus
MDELHGADIRELRLRRGDYPFYDYEALHSADQWGAGRRRLAEAILSGDWRWKGHRSIALTPPVDWDGICRENRSWNLALHSWEPLAPLLAAYDRAGDARCLELALALAADWIERFPAIDDSSASFAWYDLAVGSRGYRLAYLLDVVARDASRDDEVVRLLFGSLLVHAAALADESRFARHSNHGIYQVMGQLAMSRRFPDVPAVAEAGAQGKNRLDELFDTHFTAEGIHREHSPHYHDLILIPLRAIRSAGLVRDGRLDAVCGKCEESLAWFVTPAGRYAMFGDTGRQVVTNQDVERLGSAHLKFALSAGRVGTAPKERTKGFADSGYVIFRDRWPKGEVDFADCSYLAQTCAFHSRVHKHADDLSFVWYDRGCDILTDAGRFGYVGRTEPESELFADGFWYSDPRRIYVESTRAHNTVEVDGRSNPRRNVIPYGSALTQWGERGAIRFSESRVRHDQLFHTRLLLFLPRFWLLVVDSLVEEGDERHDLVQRFHLAPELDLAWNDGDTERSVVAELPSGDRMHAVALFPQNLVRPARGEEEPEALGWISPRDGVMEPQWTFAWSASAVRSHLFASLFCFAEQVPEIPPNENQATPDASHSRLAWNMDGRRYRVEFERVLGQSFDIDYSVEICTDFDLRQERTQGD